MFEQFNLNIDDDNLFNILTDSIVFEDVIKDKSRRGAVLVSPNDNMIPIIRTTTKYNKPVQRLLPMHYKLIENIKKTIGNNDISFNNVMMEIYDNRYRTMKYHSDQSLDLSDSPLSHICIFSHYYSLNNCDESLRPIRKLKIKQKESMESKEFYMNHNSIILFNVMNTNGFFLHKIILDDISKSKDNDYLWLGLTLRLSKTFIYFINEQPYFSHNNEMLTLANKDQELYFYKCRGQENQNIDYKYNYSDFNFTISESDLLCIE